MIKRKRKKSLEKLNTLLIFLLAKNIFFKPLLNHFKIITEFLINLLQKKNINILLLVFSVYIRGFIDESFTFKITRTIVDLICK